MRKNSLFKKPTRPCSLIGGVDSIFEETSEYFQKRPSSRMPIYGDVCVDTWWWKCLTANQYVVERFPVFVIYHFIMCWSCFFIVCRGNERQDRAMRIEDVARNFRAAGKVRRRTPFRTAAGCLKHLYGFEWRTCHGLDSVHRQLSRNIEQK